MASSVGITGTLGFDDFIFPRTPLSITRADEFDLSFTAFNQPAQISLFSPNTTALDPIVEIIDANTNTVIASDDDSGDELNSLISDFLPQAGVSYKIRVTSFNAIDTTIDNPYQLQVDTQVGDVTVTPRLSSFSGAETGTVVDFQGVLNEDDFTLPTPVNGNPSLADEYQLSFTAFNQPTQVSLASDNFDAFVQILNANTGEVVVEDDNSGSDSDALISNFLPQAGVNYRIRVTSFNTLSLPSANPLSYSLQVSTQAGQATVTPRVPTTEGDDLLNQLNTPINRFQNSSVPGTFLFAGPEESASIILNNPNFINEGRAFQVGVQPDDDLLEITRFQNLDRPGTYLFAGPEEAASVRQNNPNFVDEGIAFYVLDSAADRGIQIFRFQNTSVPGTYIFVGEEERDAILANSPNFVLEGEAFEVVA